MLSPSSVLLSGLGTVDAIAILVIAIGLAGVAILLLFSRKKI